MVVVAGAAESLVDTKDFPTIGDGIWGSIVTITTVGYGDLYPSRRKDGSSRRWSCSSGSAFSPCSPRQSRPASFKTGTQSDEVKETLARIEAELGNVKRQLAERPAEAAP